MNGTLTAIAIFLMLNLINNTVLAYLIHKDLESIKSHTAQAEG